MDLKELKKKYDELASKHQLPGFSELNENFEIEKIRRGDETLLRTIRKTMMEKVVNTMGFLEFILNPVNAPRVYLAYIRSITQDDKKAIENVYESLAELMTAALKLEIDYSEKEEAEMIKQISKKWEGIKPGFRKIVADMEKPAKFEKKERSYYG